MGGNVKGVSLERGEGNHIQGTLVGRCEHHRRSNPVVVGAEPIQSRDTPAVPGNQALETKLWHRRREIVADAALMVEELLGHDRAHRVAAVIVGPGVTRPVAEEAGERIFPARLEIGAEHIEFSHPSSMTRSA